MTRKSAPHVALSTSAFFVVDFRLSEKRCQQDSLFTRVLLSSNQQLPDIFLDTKSKAQIPKYTIVYKYVDIKIDANN